MKRSTFFTLFVVALLVILLVVDARPAPKSSNAKSWAFANWNSATSSWTSTWGIVHDSYGKQNRAFVKDPAGGSETVLRITYPAGTYAPHGSVVGGTGFYAEPIKFPSSAKTFTFQYQIYFEKGFDFVKGMILPIITSTTWLNYIVLTSNLISLSKAANCPVSLAVMTAALVAIPRQLVSAPGMHTFFGQKKKSCSTYYF